MSGLLCFAAPLKHERVVRLRVGDAERDLAVEDVGQQVAADFGSPALSQQGHFAILKATEIQSIGDQVANVFSDLWPGLLLLGRLAFLGEQRPIDGG